jgi:DNA repair photolyase
MMEQIMEKKDELKKTYGSPRWTGELNDCTLPMTLDTYSNCSFGCVYCFSQYQRGVGAGKEAYLSKKVKSINPDKVKKIFDGEKSQFQNFVKQKRPIQYGGLSDQFDGYERKYGITYEVLKHLKELNYPICFSTKSTWVFHDQKYIDLFTGQDNWNMKFSIITLDEEDAKKIEVGVDSPKKRLEAMEIYSKLNKGGATLRLRPFILGVSDKTYEELIREAHKHGATALTTEFFCLEMRSVEQAKEHYKVLSDCCGFDIVDFYRKHSNGSGYLRLNRKVKEPYVKRMKELCKELGMRFYVSDAHFKECCDNACCCGLPPEWNYVRGHFGGALQIAKRKGYVTFSEIHKDMKHWEGFDAVDAEGCQFCGGSTASTAKFLGLTMAQYLRYLWNTPKSGKSPYKLFDRVLVPEGKDEHGDLIYRYNEEVTFEKIKNERDIDVTKV